MSATATPRHALPLTLALALAASMLAPGCVLSPSVARPDLPPAAHSLARPTELPPHIRLPLIESQGYLFARMHLNRRDAGLFLIDTGASTTVVEQGLANRLKLPRLGAGTAVGVGGAERFTWRGIESLSFTDVLALPTHRAAGMSLYRLADGMGVPVNGIVGYRSFGSAPFTLDIAQRSLTIHRRDAFASLDKPEPIRLVPHGNLPLVEATLGDPEDGRVVWLLIDSGAHNELTLPIELFHRWKDILSVPEHGMGRTRGVGGSVPSTGTWVRELNVMGTSLAHVPTNFEPSGRGTGPGGIPIGRIGHSLLKDFELTFDPPKGVVYPRYRGDGGR